MVLAVALAVGGVVALPAGASAQTVDDVALRDRLIASQEALLNTYRCRFDIDTETVPGGCTGGAPTPAEEPALVAEPAPPLPALRPPPGLLRLNPFYQKYLDASGIPIISSAAVHDRALYQARSLIHEVLANRPDLIEVLASTRMRVAIMAESDVITDIPEYTGLYLLSPGRDWDTVLQGGGLGPSRAIPVLVVAEENLICLQSDRIPHADVFIHEVAHAVLTMAVEFKLKDSEFRSRVESAYASAIVAGLWQHTYAATNPDEYWAEGTLAWFNLNSPPDPIHNNVNTRAELIEYDPALAELVEEVYGDASAPSSCHQTLDISYNSVEGVVLDPHGQPVEWALLWFGSEANPDRTFDVTGADGSFIARVPNGSYTIEVHADPPGECSFVGWYGQGGFTTSADHLIRIEVADQDVLGVQITLPDELENLPYIEQCASVTAQQN
ncbi:MAG: carboxypeptidase-like regulatory domain-containing protein [bacterium]|nr:carboxypeptidase-like regulatory domain-containing protein [bacterium]